MNRSTRCLIGGVVAMLTTGCGLPSGGGSAVDDVTVPYHLLDGRLVPEGRGGGKPPASTESLVFWVDERGLLVPRTAVETCPIDLSDLLDELSAGPTQQVREQGLTTALPPDYRLEPVSAEDDLVVVDLATESRVSADRLPVAIGQVVLTLASAPGIARVSLLSDGEPLQVPDAGGALSTTPVTADAYASLVPRAHRRSSPFRRESPAERRCPTVE